MYSTTASAIMNQDATLFTDPATDTAITVTDEPSLESDFTLDDPQFQLSVHDAIDVLVARRNSRVAQLTEVSNFMQNAMANDVLTEFLYAEEHGIRTNEEIAEETSRRKALPEHFRFAHETVTTSDPHRHRAVPVNPGRLFMLEPAVKALDARMWREAMDLTDVRSLMPAKERQTWDEAIRDSSTPLFEEATVRATLQDVFSRRTEFFAQKIDGVFRALSGEHVTNSPSGFNRRMILANVYDADFGSLNYGRAEVIQDLLFAIAKFMGAPEPSYGAASTMLNAVRRAGTGTWFPAMGNALRIRVYMKGTAHLEVHPEMAARLNQMLHHLYPAAIPPAQRRKPARIKKEWGVLQRTLPADVINALARLRWVHSRRCEAPFNYTSKTLQAVHKELMNVLWSLGASPFGDGRVFDFDYPAQELLQQVIANGVIPDQVSHQFYPTPSHIAHKLVELAEIPPGSRCLEPSAGNGDIAALIDGVECVEINPMRCDVLHARGMAAVQCDFLQYGADGGMDGAYDRIVMNPPFSDGRWQAHLQHAWQLLAKGGRIAAVLPSSAKNKEILPGCEYHDVYDFPGTSIQVVLMTANKA